MSESITAQQRIRVLRLQSNLTLQALAERANTTKSQIDKLEKGERRLTLDWINRLAAALNVEPTTFLRPDKPPTPTLKENISLDYGYDNNVVPFQSAVTAPTMLPIYGQIEALTGYLTQLDTVVGHVQCPPQLMDVPKAYSVYVPDDSMSPRYNMGETLFLHPLKPLTPDCYILVQTQDGTASIKQFKGRQKGQLLVAGIDQEIQFISIKTLQSAHRIVGCWE